MHVIHCEIILLSLCNLIKGSWCDPLQNVRGIKIWLSKKPQSFQRLLIKHGSYAKLLLLVEVQPGIKAVALDSGLESCCVSGVLTWNCLSLSHRSQLVSLWLQLNSVASLSLCLCKPPLPLLLACPAIRTGRIYQNCLSYTACAVIKMFNNIAKYAATTTNLLLVT